MQGGAGERTRWTDRLKALWRGNKKIRLMLTLELAVMLPAAALIYLNFHQLKDIRRDKVLEAAIHRDFGQMLAIAEKQISHKTTTMADAIRGRFPSPDIDKMDRVQKLDWILSEHPELSHVFVFEADRGMVFRSQPRQTGGPYFSEEHQALAKAFGGWFTLEGKSMLERMQKRTRPIIWHTERLKRAGGYVYLTTALFSLPRVSTDRVVIGGASFDPDYMTQTFLPQMLDELVAHKLSEDGGNPLAMVVYAGDAEGDSGSSGLTGGYWIKPLAASAGWNEGKPEVSRNFADVFPGLTLGIKFQGTSVDALGRSWVQRSFLTLGVLSLLLCGGLVLTYRSVSKEVALAKLKSDFVSNVSHELRTPLSLIRLYAETLELGRVKGQAKVEEYYRIIRKESERLTALINNILDFSRIEAGRKEYEFRQTDLAELVSNTLDTYRDQIDEHGFTFEQRIDSDIPAVSVDREAIARSLVNLVNNALKYSDREKFLGVKLYRVDRVLKLEVADRGIGIPRTEQSKIFEKFYRAGDPLVHNTKGSGLGLSLVRHIAHAHGGEVAVESTPGKGSTFTLTLPLDPAAQPQAGATVRMAG
jgi:signal transduction histidine kinase